MPPPHPPAQHKDRPTGCALLTREQKIPCPRQAGAGGEMCNILLRSALPSGGGGGRLPPFTAPPEAFLGLPNNQHRNAENAAER